MGKWPDPSDNQLDISRALLYSYRQALMDENPLRCQRLDEAARELGQAWVAPSATDPQVGERVTTEQAADLLGLSPATIRGWVSKSSIPISRGADGLLDVAELLEYRASQRRRRGHR